MFVATFWSRLFGGVEVFATPSGKYVLAALAVAAELTLLALGAAALAAATAEQSTGPNSFSLAHLCSVLHLRENLSLRPR